MRKLKYKNLEERIRDCHPGAEQAIRESIKYRHISLLFVPFKILERFIYPTVELIIDPLLPREQAKFWRERSTVDQVTLPTQKIEDSFLAKKKAAAVFVNLTCQYDTVWHRGLICKLLRLLPSGRWFH